MFFTVRLKWWKVLCFVLVLVIVGTGMYFMQQKSTAAPSTIDTREGQVWQV